MPLSDEFTKTRLNYLKTAINNNDFTNQDFYPRFQRAYNEMFPYTEGTVGIRNNFNLNRSSRNILNPQKQIVQSGIMPPDPALIELSLKDKLNELTRDQASTDFIVNTLDEAEIFYYDKNFESVTKELSKKMKMPASKEEFARYLAIVLNSDAHKNGVFGAYKYINPMPTRAALAAAQISAGAAAAGPIIIPAGPAGPPGNPIQQFPPAGTIASWASPQLASAIFTFQTIPNPPLTQQDNINKIQAEQDIGTLLFKMVWMPMNCVNYFLLQNQMVLF